MPLRNTINREAKAFLSLFRAKVGGQGPRLLREDVQPIVDVAPFLSAGQLVTKTQSVFSVANATKITVPANEVWQLISANVTVNVTSTAADQHAFSVLDISEVPNGTPGAAQIDARVALAYTRSTATGQNMQAFGAFNPPQPLLLSSGMGLEASITATVAATAKLQVLYYKLEN